MSKYSQFKLALKDLPKGKTDFEYKLDDSFFKLINDEESDVKRGKLAVDVVVNRTSVAFDVLFEIKGEVRVPCDRCLDDLYMGIDAKQKLVVKFGKEYAEESDEIVVIPEDEGEINIAWFIYEFIILSLPAKRVHPSGECNKTMSKKLKQHKSVDPNDEDEDFEDDDLDVEDDGGDNMGGGDPRWDTLKDLEIE